MNIVFSNICLADFFETLCGKGMDEKTCNKNNRFFITGDLSKMYSYIK